MLKQTIDRFHPVQEMKTAEYDVFIQSTDKSPEAIPHHHDFYEMHYLLSDSLDYVVGNRLYSMKKGDFLLLSPGLLHYPKTCNKTKGRKCERIVLRLSLPFYEELCRLDPQLEALSNAFALKRTCLIHPSTISSKHMHTLLLRLMDNRRTPMYSSRALEVSILLETLDLANRLVHSSDDPEDIPQKEDIFTKMIYHIHTHLSDNLSLSVLSELFYISPGYITRIFKETIGIPAHQYILSLRLEVIRKAIQNGAAIADAADLYGFRDYSTFYRAFKNAFGISPRAYQATSRQNSEEIRKCID